MLKFKPLILGHADQMIRGSVVLPNGTGHNVRVAVFAKGAKVDEAKRLGADICRLQQKLFGADSGRGVFLNFRFW